MITADQTLLAISIRKTVLPVAPSLGNRGWRGLMKMRPSEPMALATGSENVGISSNSRPAEPVASTMPLTFSSAQAGGEGPNRLAIQPPHPGPLPRSTGGEGGDIRVRSCPLNTVTLPNFVHFHQATHRPSPVEKNGRGQRFRLLNECGAIRSVN